METKKLLIILLIIIIIILFQQFYNRCLYFTNSGYNSAKSMSLTDDNGVLLIGDNNPIGPADITSSLTAPTENIFIADGERNIALWPSNDFQTYLTTWVNKFNAVLRRIYEMKFDSYVTVASNFNEVADKNQTRNNLNIPSKASLDALNTSTKQDITSNFTSLIELLGNNNNNTMVRRTNPKVNKSGWESFQYLESIENSHNLGGDYVLSERSVKTYTDNVIDNSVKMYYYESRLVFNSASATAIHNFNKVPDFVTLEALITVSIDGLKKGDRYQLNVGHQYDRGFTIELNSTNVVVHLNNHKHGKSRHYYKFNAVNTDAFQPRDLHTENSVLIVKCYYFE